MKMIAKVLVLSAVALAPTGTWAQQPTKTQIATRHQDPHWLGDGLNRLALLLPSNRHGGASEQTDGRR